MKNHNHKFQIYSFFFLTSLFILTGCNSNKTTIKPEIQDIVESVYASAAIKSADQYAVFATVSGILQSNMVKEGDTVIAGQTIAQIENTNPGLNADNARIALELANKNLGNLDEIGAQVSNARKQNIGSKSQLDARQLAYDASKNNLRAIQTRYRQTSIQLALAKNQAENNVSITSKSSNDFVITSKINGRVYALNYKPGELVMPQQAIALIGRAGQFILELQVDEVDVSRVVMGQLVLISMDAYPGKAFEAKVSRILPNMDPKTQTFKVEAEFVQTPPSLYPGLSAEANIVVGKKSGALVIPLEYLKNDGTVITNDGPKSVKTGMRSMDKVEILDGINKDTELLKPE
jgi:HlyD family secretion protein